MDPDQGQSDLGPHCLSVCKNRFEKSARILSRRHKQTTFSDAVFLGALRVNYGAEIHTENQHFPIAVKIQISLFILAFCQDHSYR